MCSEGAEMHQAHGLLLLLSICWIHASSALATSIHPYRSYHHIITSQSEYKSSLDSQSYSKADLSTTSNTLSKRIALEDGWDVHWFDGPAYLPVGSTSKILAHFYSQIIHQSLESVHARRAPLHRLSYQAGYISWSWSCQRTPVPWDLIHAVAMQMLEMTLRGYTMQYIAKFVHATGLEINMDMVVGSVPEPDASSSTRGRLRR